MHNCTCLYNKRGLNIIFVVIVIVTSCAPAYIPNMVNAPLFSNKGEFTANVGGGTSGFDAQVAYAASGHIAVMVNSSFSDQSNHSNNDLSDNKSFHNHRFVEGAIGYYDTPTKSVNFEIFGGWGLGKANSYTSFFADSISGNYNRILVQPSMGFVSDFFDIGFSPRFVWVFFDGVLKESYSNVSGNSLFVEPTLTLKVGFKQVKFFGQLGLSYRINSSSYRFDYQPLLFSFGTQLTLGRKREKSIID